MVLGSVYVCVGRLCTLYGRKLANTMILFEVLIMSDESMQAVSIMEGEVRRSKGGLYCVLYVSGK